MAGAAVELESGSIVETSPYILSSSYYILDAHPHPPDVTSHHPPLPPSNGLVSMFGIYSVTYRFLIRHSLGDRSDPVGSIGCANQSNGGASWQSDPYRR